MLSFSNIMIGTADSKALAAFYEKVFDRSPDMVDEAGGFYGWQVGNCFFSLGTHSEVTGTSKEPARIMINFETKEVREEFAKIKAAGATVIKEPYQMGEGEDAPWIATFADIDGNYFQLMPPWAD